MKIVSKFGKNELIRFAPYIGICLIFIILPFLTGSYILSIVTKAIIFALFAMSLDILFGYMNLITMGHALYFGTAAFTAGYLMVKQGITSFWVCSGLGTLGAGLLAAITGPIALRVYGMYFMLVTLALGQLGYTVIFKYIREPGLEGMVGIKYPTLGIPGLVLNTDGFYYLVFAVFAVCFFLLYRLVRSPFGYAIQGIRQDETRMKSIGYNTWLYKYIAFIIAGLFAGLAGTLFAYYSGVIVANHVGVFTSVYVILMVIIGGPGTLFGPILGSFILVSLENIISAFTPERWYFILGVVFVLAAMFLRGGIWVYLLKARDKIRGMGYLHHGDIKG